MSRCKNFRLVKEVITPRKLEVIDGGLDEWIAKHGLDDAIHGYTDTDYGYINRALVSGGKLEQIAPDLAKLFNHKGNYKGTVFRGTRLPNEIVHTLNKGTLVMNDMILSTTVERSIYKGSVAKARYFSDTMVTGNTRQYKAVILDIQTYSNPQFDISMYSKYHHENEVLIAPKNIMHITNIAHNKDHTIIRMELLPAAMKLDNFPLVKGLMGMSGLMMMNEGEDNGNI